MQESEPNLLAVQSPNTTLESPRGIRVVLKLAAINGTEVPLELPRGAVGKGADRSDDALLQL